ncbi:hypothetical protein IMZ48_10080 [Candidatus Bathyarchaeota archaeon]|nr:hypothetical protein [Candidatus Bathyarchaeota archaeon]
MSLGLEHLSASFMVDASHFFHVREPSWTWPNLTSLALTSRLLAPDESSTGMEDMLREAAAAAMKMPKLETMEIWNGREGLAMLFRYQAGRPAVITWRGTGTWEPSLWPPVLEAWKAVADKHCGRGCEFFEEQLDPNLVNSHGDAIHLLGLSSEVIRPVSLQQIQREHRIRGDYS